MMHTRSVDGTTRREVLEALGVLFLSADVLIKAMEMYSHGEPGRRLARERRERLMRLFFPLDEFNVVPAKNHPTISLPSGKDTYVSVERGIGAIRGLYQDPVDIVNKMFPVDDSKSLVVVGAPNSNAIAERVLGKETAPRFVWNFNGQMVELAYSIRALGGHVTRMRDGQAHGAPHRGICTSGRLIASPKPVGAALLRRDYLLVTRVPLGDRTLVSFAGLHGPATRSLHQLFFEIEGGQLAELHDRVDLAEYFQAIFEVEVAEEEGTSVPLAIRLVKDSVRTFKPKLLDRTPGSNRSTQQRRK